MAITSITDDHQTLLQTLLMGTKNNAEFDQQQQGYEDEEEEEINFEFANKPEEEECSEEEEEEEIIVEGLMCYECGCVGQCYCLSQFCPPNRMTAYAQSLAWQEYLIQPSEDHHVYGGDSYLETIYEDVEYYEQQHQRQHQHDNSEHDDLSSSLYRDNEESVSESNFVLLMEDNDLGNLLGELYDSDDDDDEVDLLA